MGRAILIGVMVVMLAGACIWAGWVWVSLGDAEISTDGTIALTLGIVVSMVVGTVLMVLVFYSARRGYDEQVTYDFGEADEHRSDDSGRA